MPRTGEQAGNRCIRGRGGDNVAVFDLLRRWYHKRSQEPWVRPWGLATPVLVLIVCLPMLRPLRYPYAASAQENENEIARLAMVKCIVEHRTVFVDQKSFHDIASGIATKRGDFPADYNYNRQPPVLAALLAGPYWAMRKFGLSFENNLVMVSYLLTLLGVTLPVAAAGGMIYRMGRLFELRRPWRTLLGVACVFGSGLVSYATVLNSNAPAAALVVASCASLFHGAITHHRARAVFWLVLSGLTVSLAAMIDLGAIPFLLLLVLVILSLPWPMSTRVAGIGWYVLGAAPAIALHIALTVPLMGSVVPGFLHRGPSPTPTATAAPAPQEDPDEDDVEGISPGPLDIAAIHLADGLLGPHGLISHFPILILGVGGIGTVLSRNWPRSTKTLAAVCLAAAILVVGGYVIADADWSQPMFAVRWFIVFMPMLIFWIGPWLRRPHAPGGWATAGTVLGVSILISLLGAASPFTPAKAGQYTAYVAAKQAFSAPAKPSRGRTTLPTSRPVRPGR